MNDGRAPDYQCEHIDLHIYTTHKLQIQIATIKNR